MSGLKLVNSNGLTLRTFYVLTGSVRLAKLSFACAFESQFDAKAYAIKRKKNRFSVIALNG